MEDQKQRTLTVSWHDKIADIDAKAWDALAGLLPTPILEWDWLHQMEASKSIAPSTGWVPSHLTVWSDGRLIAAAPLYVKGHSVGEFVYDYAWADVARQLGLRYYPKLVGMSPATPSVGYRFLIAPGEDEEALTELMLREIDRFCERNRLSSVSFHFVDPEWRTLLVRRGFTGWMHQSYEWHNREFASFDDYLALFNKNQRRNIKRERKSLEEQGIVLKALRGEEIPRSYFPLMYQLYERQNAQFGPWAAKFFNRPFFLGLADGFRHRLLFMSAYESHDLDRPIAMSFLLTKGEVLIGRYWGTNLEASNLYFNACYYSPIEWAIEHGIRSFDPGAGSPLKIRRGFEAIENYSLHRFVDRRMQKIMDTYIGEINSEEQRQIDYMNAALPFARDQEGGLLRLEGDAPSDGRPARSSMPRRSSDGADPASGDPSSGEDEIDSE